MVVGDAMRRTKKYRNQSCFRCYSGPNFGGDNAAPCSDSKLDFEGFPPHPCQGGIRSNVLYPTYECYLPIDWYLVTDADKLLF